MPSGLTIDDGVVALASVAGAESTRPALHPE